MPYAEVGGYTVAASQEYRFCFATTSAASDAGETMVYSYYQTDDGRRWHVAGYEAVDLLNAPKVSIGVLVDEETTLAARETETRDGDFMLPFQTLDEITGHEAAVASGDILTILIGGDDSLSLPLDDHRAALGAITACLAEF